MLIKITVLWLAISASLIAGLILLFSSTLNNTKTKKISLLIAGIMAFLFSISILSVGITGNSSSDLSHQVLLKMSLLVATASFGAWVFLTVLNFRFLGRTISQLRKLLFATHDVGTLPEESKNQKILLIVVLSVFVFSALAAIAFGIVLVCLL
jgi:hypothetical protein